MAIYQTTIGKTRSFDVDFAALPAVSQEKIIAYGVQRIFNDMVGGSERFPTLDDKCAHVEATIARFMAGDVGRAAKEGVSVETGIARAEARRLLKLKMGAKSAEWATFTGLPDDEQVAHLDTVVEKNKAHFDKFVAAEMKARKAAAEARKGALGSIDLTI